MSSKGKSYKQKTKVQDEACASSDSSNPLTEENEQNIENVMDQFERELYWCIDQLELGLETQKPDSKRAQDSIKVLKILTSSKAPMIKKRQAMRNTFGDYRKKMQDEEKKSSAAAKKIKLSGMDKSEMEKSQFFKKSRSQRKNKNEGKLKNATDIDNCFKFKFSISETNNEDGETSTKDKENEANQTENAISDIPGKESTSSKQFAFVKSSNDFKFNFTVADET